MIDFAKVDEDVGRTSCGFVERNTRRVWWCGGLA